MQEEEEKDRDDGAGDEGERVVCACIYTRGGQARAEGRHLRIPGPEGIVVVAGRRGRFHRVVVSNVLGEACELLRQRDDARICAREETTREGSNFGSAWGGKVGWEKPLELGSSAKVATNPQTTRQHIPYQEKTITRGTRRMVVRWKKRGGLCVEPTMLR